MARQTVQISASVGQRIRETRIRLGWSQKDLARAADVSAKWISCVENNHISSVDVVHLNRVTNALDLNPGDLLSNTAEGKHQESNCRYQAWAEDHAIPALTMALFQPEPIVALAAFTALKAIGTREANEATRFFASQLLIPTLQWNPTKKN
jgi:transcriptional regulator with XRE-family HTH domain